MVLRRSLLALVLVLALPTAVPAEEVGTGPLVLSPGVAAAYERFKRLARPLYFAVSRNGRWASWTYREEFGPCRRWSARSEAVRQWGKIPRQSPCYIYVDANRVLWKGKVSIGREPAFQWPEDAPDPGDRVDCDLGRRGVIAMTRASCAKGGGRPIEE